MCSAGLQPGTRQPLAFVLPRSAAPRMPYSGTAPAVIRTRHLRSWRPCVTLRTFESSGHSNNNKVNSDCLFLYIMVKYAMFAIEQQLLVSGEVADELVSLSAARLDRTPPVTPELTSIPGSSQVFIMRDLKSFRIRTYRKYSITALECALTEKVGGRGPRSHSFALFCT